MSSSTRPTDAKKPQGERRSAGRGRRQSDQPRSTAATIAIVGSFLFSGGLMVWSFTKPFRSGALGELSDAPTAQGVQLEYEARLTSEEYLDYAKDLDDQLFEAMREESYASRPYATKELNRFQREERREKIRSNHVELLENLKDDLEEGESFRKGTIQWEYEQQVKKFLNESDE
ncbi:MAG: hypothetical protein AAFX06_09075 [Planctomycetota bacterium]